MTPERRLRTEDRRRAMRRQDDAERGPVPAWLQSGSALAWRLLVIGAVVLAVLWILSRLRVVALPVIIALLVTTLLQPPVARLRRTGLPAGAAAATVMLTAGLLLAGLLALVAPPIASQADELGAGVQQGINQIGDYLAEPPFNLSTAELRERLDAGIQQLRENSGTVLEQIQSGALLLVEIVTGLFIVVLLTFFFLKDGDRMWAWLTGLARPERRAAWDEVGGRVFTALGGYARGIALVGLIDALLIGAALLAIGVPLVLPLMVLTFIAAFLPLIGAFVAGLAAVLIALVSNGVVAALLVLGAIVLVQQVEGNLLYPLLMGRTVHLHPAVIIVALGIGGILAGIVGIFLAVPAAGILSVLLDYAREQRGPAEPAAAAAGAERGGPASPALAEPAAGVAGGPVQG